MVGPEYPRLLREATREWLFQLRAPFTTGRRAHGGSKKHLIFMCPVGKERRWLLCVTFSVCAAGVKTGHCLKDRDNIRGTCEILAWCPVEKRSKPKYVAILCCFQA